MASTTPCVRPCNGLPVPQLAAASTPDDWATVGARPVSPAVATAIAMAAITATAAATLDNLAKAARHNFRTLVPPPVYSFIVPRHIAPPSAILPYPNTSKPPNPLPSKRNTENLRTNNTRTRQDAGICQRATGSVPVRPADTGRRGAWRAPKLAHTRGAWPRLSRPARGRHTRTPKASRCTPSTRTYAHKLASTMAYAMIRERLRRARAPSLGRTARCRKPSLGQAD